MWPWQGGRWNGRFSPDRKLSEAEFTVRAEAYQLKSFSVRLAVNQQKVGAEVAVPVILPLPD
jgi:hypothetical protein